MLWPNVVTVSPSMRGRGAIRSTLQGQRIARPACAQQRVSFGVLTRHGIYLLSAHVSENKKNVPQVHAGQARMFTPQPACPALLAYLRSG